MSDKSIEFKKAAAVYAGSRIAKPVLENGLIVFRDIDAIKAGGIVEQMIQQGSLFEGEATGFRFVPSRVPDGLEELKLLPPRASRPWDVSYDPALRTLTIYPDAINDKGLNWALNHDCMAGEALAAFADDEKKGLSLRAAFSSIVSASFDQQMQPKLDAVQAAWAAVQSSGIEDKLDHGAIAKALRSAARDKQTRDLIT
jgi:hypothetical protein